MILRSRTRTANIRNRDRTLAHTLHDAAAWMNGTVDGDGTTTWNRAASLLDARAGDLVLVDGKKQLEAWAKSPAVAAVVPVNFPAGTRPLIRVAEPLKAYLALILRLRGERPTNRSIHPTSIVDPSATLGANASIGPYTVIGPNSIIGADCTLHAGVTIGADCVLGRAVELHPGVVLYGDTVLGDRVVIHAKSIIGADGFGYRIEAGVHVKIPQLGYVEIGDDVEIGTSATIDRGTIGPTRIGEGTKIDNLVMIAHNVQIGRRNLIVSQVGIAGSSTTGEYVAMGGQVGVADHVHIGDYAQLGAQCGVLHDVDARAKIVGSPPLPVLEFLRAAKNFRHLPELVRRMAELEKKSNPPDDAP